MTKRKVSWYGGPVEHWKLEDKPLVEVAEYFKELAEKYPNCHLSISANDNEIEMSLTTYREETDEEYAKRLEAEKRTKLLVEAGERTRLKQLLEKYGIPQT